MDNKPPFIPLTTSFNPTPIYIGRCEDTATTVAEINRNMTTVFPELQAVEVTEGYRFGYDNRKFWKFSATVPKRTKTGSIRVGVFQTITVESEVSLWDAYRGVLKKHFAMAYPHMESEL